MNSEQKKKLLHLLPLVIVVLVFYIAVPLHWSLDTFSHDRSVAHADNVVTAKYQTEIAEAEQVADHRGQWENLLTQLDSVIPASVDFSGVVDQLTALTTTTRVAWTSGSLGAPTIAATSVTSTPGTAYAVPIPISMSITGSPSAIAAFLSGMQTMSRLVVLDSASITSSSPGAEVASIKATAFLAR